jgi:hypothetical protein
VLLGIPGFPDSPLHHCSILNSGLKRRANIEINYELRIRNYEEVVIVVIMHAGQAGCDCFML